jgi:hypothetical protein
MLKTRLEAEEKVERHLVLSSHRKRQAN